MTETEVHKIITSLLDTCTPELYNMCGVNVGLRYADPKDPDKTLFVLDVRESKCVVLHHGDGIGANYTALLATPRAYTYDAYLYDKVKTIMFNLERERRLKRNEKHAYEEWKKDMLLLNPNFDKYDNS